MGALLVVSAGSFAYAAGAMPVFESGGSIEQEVVHTTSGWVESGFGAASSDAEIGAAWNGEARHIDWKGGLFETIETNFVGDRVIVPGDRVERQLYLTNNGPSAAVLSVHLHPSKNFTDIARNPELATAVTMYWQLGSFAPHSNSFHNLHALGNPQIVQALVTQGQTMPLTLGFEFPISITEHYAAGEISQLLEFEVRVRMAGESVYAPALVPSPTPTLVPTPTPVVTPVPAPPQVPPPPDDLPVTGASILGAASLAGALSIFGWLLLAGRRRRCEVCDTPLPRRNRGKACEGAPFTCEMALALAASVSLGGAR